ncbi:type II secretion system protein [Porticoccus sp. W117]|uniref:type II secretion system protein n=1 Tax=Porticoccus sp. W117 TaxID=3054777 RepID=UPI0025992D49|nr:type II secretion system protein [Porticoccus sp. W117]MDM3870892.1 type II secretion system protein [Porticoccus sp. W117]
MNGKVRGFTFTELAVVIVVLGIVAAVASARFSSTALAEVQATRDNIVAGLFYTQQIAIARGNSSTVQFVASGNSVSVEEDGATLDASNYPLTLPSGITLTPSTTLVFDKLGRTTATTFTLSDGFGTSATITVEATGYAH